MVDHARALALIGPFEGRIPWMYLDRKGLVTAGIGNMLPSAQAAIALIWHLRGSGEEATPVEIADDFRRISDAVANLEAHRYKALTRCELADGEITRLFGRRVDEFCKQLEREFPLFPEWPDQAQLATLDMVYSMGIGKLCEKFPHFCAALRSMEWLTAAAHCHRQDGQPARNNAVRDLYLAAARAGAIPQEEVT